MHCYYTGIEYEHGPGFLLQLAFKLKTSRVAFKPTERFIWSASLLDFAKRLLM